MVFINCHNFNLWVSTSNSAILLEINAYKTQKNDNNCDSKIKSKCTLTKQITNSYCRNYTSKCCAEAVMHGLEIIHLQNDVFCVKCDVKP